MSDGRKLGAKAMHHRLHAVAQEYRAAKESNALFSARVGEWSGHIFKSYGRCRMELYHSAELIGSLNGTTAECGLALKSLCRHMAASPHLHIADRDALNHIADTLNAERKTQP